MRKILTGSLVVVLLSAAAGVYLLLNGEEATLAVEEGYGASPVLPEPNATILPTVNIAEASSWPVGKTPTPAAGLKVNAFAKDFDHPRWIYVLPNGDVLVAETNKPPQLETGFSPKAWIMGLVMGQAGAQVPSANRITLVRDADGDGVAEIRSTFLQGLNSPFGMALANGKLYVANTDAIVAFPFKDGDTEITAAPEKIVDLPAGPINHHWTKDVIASADETKLYATVGSNSNVGENGIEAEENRAAVLELEIATRVVRFLHQACATRMACPGSRIAASFGSLSTNGTKSAAISFPTI
jgi:glucose/arabinose dehydrogenase